MRRTTKEIKVGDICIGGHAPVSVQSMLNLPTALIEENIRQAQRLQEIGCDLVRTAVPDRNAVRLICALKERVRIPVVADIHYDYKIALEAAEAGADKIRINPGNIGSDSGIKEVVKKCRAHNIPIRIGVNAGSIEREILNKYGKPTSEALRDSALYHVRLLERFDFDQIVISIKSSDVQMMRNAYEAVAAEVEYPLHLGVTEAGTERMGLIKSAIGIGALLTEGIGDTIRVSLTDKPEKEVLAGLDILRASGLRRQGIEIISCPTCGRTKIDLIALVKAVEEKTAGLHKNIKIAVMGCSVNGPGEAREADIGIAAGEGSGILFKKGEIVRKIPDAELLNELMKEVLLWENPRE